MAPTNRQWRRRAQQMLARQKAQQRREDAYWKKRHRAIKAAAEREVELLRAELRVAELELAERKREDGMFGRPRKNVRFARRRR